MSTKNQASHMNHKVIIMAALLSVVCLLLFLKNYFLLITLSAILAYLLNPVYLWFMKKTKKQGFSVSATIVVLFFIVVVPVTALLAITASQAVILVDSISQAGYDSSSVAQTINNLIANFNEQVIKLPFVDSNPLSSDQLKQWFQEAASVIASTTLNFIKSFAGGIASFFTMLIIFLFVFSSMLKNQAKIIFTLEKLNPLGKDMNNSYLDKMGAMTSAMVKGQFAIAFAQGLSATISLWIIGFDYLAFFFVILSFLSIIPLGAGIVIIPIGIIMVLSGNIWQGLLLLGWHFLITTNIDNVLRPRFVPKSARLDPALTILSVFAGLGLFGFLGIIIGPVIMIVLLTTIDMYLKYIAQNKPNSVSHKD